VFSKIKDIAQCVANVLHLVQGERAQLASGLLLKRDLSHALTWSTMAQAGPVDRVATMTGQWVLWCEVVSGMTKTVRRCALITSLPTTTAGRIFCVSLPT
jgi:hypothetical protein